ncbi:SCP2 sterol-binding domain-containing protein [Thermotalea metallivorans]|uniref:SCP2 domain-containing protein n=1 Tax=Thermotalea metallivorans TaxID=520762 RepID=A0A140L7A0_9FIRM|nr:SCP2 sterol-binding domain-containing protein [Thermotalea metallivorans]KXG76425.1 hypothetical protein AN619_09560 [Thermotalea metallivorans]
MSDRKTYASGKKFWQVITTMVDFLNADQEENGYIPEDLELKVGYRMDDIGFHHTIVIENGYMKAKEGILEDADVIVKISSQTFHDMNTGKLNPMEALTASLFDFEKGDIGQILLAGNMPTMAYYRRACEKHGIQ